MTQLSPVEQQTNQFFEGIKSSFSNIKMCLGRIMLASSLMAGALLAVNAEHQTAASADEISDILASYPDKDMPCEHYDYKPSGACKNYDWGPLHTESYNDSSEYSDRGYAYRNCTDYVAWRESTIGVTVSKGLGNGGDWYNNSPASQQSKTPKAWDAAVAPDGSYGHVAFVESVNSDGTITVSEYNHNGLGTGDTRTGKPADMGFTEFVDFGKHPEDGQPSSGSSSVDNTVLRVIKKTDKDGTNDLYWAKKDGVFEQSWSPRNGNHLVNLVQIPQGDIVDIDAEIKPDGEHLVYTATAHNIWESYWYPGGGYHINPIITNAGNILRIQKTEGPDGTDQLYVMNDKGVDEYWWHPGQGIHGSNIFPLINPVAMKKVTEPDGTQELYVANTAYAYRNWWGDGQLHQGQEIMYIPQADITSLDFSRDPNGVKRLYVGRQRDGVWEATWYTPEGGIQSWQVAGSSEPITDIQKWMEGNMNVLYVSTGKAMIEYYWPIGSRTVGGDVMLSNQGGIHDLDRAVNPDGAQAVYTAVGPHIDETYWFRGGDGVHTNTIE